MNKINPLLKFIHYVRVAPTQKNTNKIIIIIKMLHVVLFCKIGCLN
jgi:hypothetical protein